MLKIENTAIRLKNFNGKWGLLKKDIYPMGQGDFIGKWELLKMMFSQRSKRGNLLTDDRDIMLIWKKYFTNLL